MKRRLVSVSLAAYLFLVVSWIPVAIGQTQSATASALPRLVRFGGVVKDVNGNPLSGIVGVTFALYSEQTGDAPLWLETQNITADSSGHYMALLGSTKPDGLPAEMFTTEQARWVGVQVSGQPEQARVLLVSAPYALKAGDAETLGGLPPSAFVLAAPPVNAASAGTNASATAQTATPAASSNVTTSGGTANTIPLFSTSTDIQNSVITQTGSGATAKIGIGIATPAATLDVKGGAYVRGPLTLPSTGVATATAGKNSQPEVMIASAFNSGTATAVNEKFQLQAEPAGNDTATTSGTLNLLYGSGTAVPAETGLKINNLGQITFATGQAFIGNGSGLTNVTAANTNELGGLAGSAYAQLAAANTFTANQAVNGSVTAGQFISTAAQGTAPLQLSSTTLVPNLNASYLGGFSAAAFQPAGAYATMGSNTFTGNQSVTGNLVVSGMVTGNSFNVGSNAFAFGNYTNQNSFLGFGGNTTMTGTGNIAVGVFALPHNVSGGGNTGVGVEALYSNTAGSFNTAIGETAGQTVDSSNLTGSYNTAVGTGARFGTGSVTNATAIGANAEVTEPYALVLGGISGINGATANTNVGIGTTAPAATLDVHGTGNFTGLVTFAAGQTFPGVADVGSANTFTSSQTFNGGLTSSSVTANFLSSNGSIAAVGDTLVDVDGFNTGSYTPGIRFGLGNTGEGISSDRAGTVNQNGIDFYTDFTPRMSVTNSGAVGIGTTSPQATLDVNGTVTARTNMVVNGNLSIGGDVPMSHSPRMVWSTFIAGSLDCSTGGIFGSNYPACSGGDIWTEEPIVVTRINASENETSSDVGCVLVGDSNGNGYALVLTNGGTWDSGPINLAFPAGDNVAIAASGFSFEFGGGGPVCNVPSGNAASNVRINVQYRMQ